MEGKQKMSDDVSLNIDRILNQLRTELLVLYKKEKVDCIIDGIHEQIIDYVQDNPMCTESDIRTHINIDDFISDWLENAEPNEIKEKLNSSAINTRFGIYTLVIAIIAICIFLLFVAIAKYISSTGLNNIKITNIVR